MYSYSERIHNIVPTIYASDSPSRKAYKLQMVNTVFLWFLHSQHLAQGIAQEKNEQNFKVLIEYIELKTDILVIR